MGTIMNGGKIVIGNNAGSNITIDTSNRSVTFNNAGSASVTYDLSKSMTTGSFNLGVVNYTLNSSGTGTMSFSAGLASGNIAFNTSGTITAGQIAYGEPVAGGYTGAKFSFSRQSDGTYIGNGGAGVSWPSWMGSVGTNLNGKTWQTTGNFNLSVTDPCTLLGGAAGNACKALSDAAQNGGVAPAEAKQMKELEVFAPSNENSVIDDATFAAASNITESVNTSPYVSFSGMSSYGYYDEGYMCAV
ncbi:hypothetical protein SNE35_05765 [Paucibacter sp. R3-3]|uniref:Uncharacterized protein n=1 Tax=Roseateles agri TaxID=3098619 RepID=A0ABU5DFE8_9BURK|nr:hypothetical protein [Paucibacter sp. R3-3]MDY0743999.1 hypothetical protein [Paucibacter sp. R3-3]